MKAAIPALDAIDFDDENSFNSPTTIAFGVMLGKLGYHVAPDAFDDASYWTNVVSQINNQLPGTVDGVHLQAYAGGSGNNPCAGWNFGTVPVWPGLWDQDDTPSRSRRSCPAGITNAALTADSCGSTTISSAPGLPRNMPAPSTTRSPAADLRSQDQPSVFLNQSSTANAVISITDFGGFTGTVTLTVSGLPKGVTAAIRGAGQQTENSFQCRHRPRKPDSPPLPITGTSGT